MVAEKGPLSVAKAPCKSCPYRKDVPSGVWDRSEYKKLVGYDAPVFEQLVNGSTGRFDCHQRDGNLCAGWLATHGPNNLLALRMSARFVPEFVWLYETDVPVFASGAEAAAHGMKDIRRPGEDAKRMIATLSNKSDRDGWGPK